MSFTIGSVASHRLKIKLVVFITSSAVISHYGVTERGFRKVIYSPWIVHTGLQKLQKKNDLSTNHKILNL